MTETYRHTHRVTYADCTIDDHIYHSRYLDLMEAARGEFMRSIGDSVQAVRAAGYVFPVIEAHVKYKYPARYDDLLTIEVWTTRVEGVRLNFGHRILNQHGKVLLEGETLHCCTSREDKPKRLPEYMVTKLSQFLHAPGK